MKYILYTEGYKYQLEIDYEIQTEIHLEKDIVTSYAILKIGGFLIIKAGYAWDGPSGPAMDTLNFMRGSLVHDALYQMMRDNLVDFDYRKYVDGLLREICIEDGMSRIRAWWVYKGVRLGAGRCANPRNVKRVIRAPA